jgi:sugar/nucleoside kinase (ribokinase family)
VKVESGPIVAVLGAINVDLVVSGAPLPRPGETVSGGEFATHQGGKGGNQAVAARRALAGQHIRMFHRPGDRHAGIVRPLVSSDFFICLPLGDDLH